MSSSSLWGVNRKFNGEEIIEFGNSWWFTPVACNILFKKYLPEKASNKPDYITATMFDNSIFKDLNNQINNCEVQEDRIVWEMTNQQMFFVKDKEFIANCIDRFLTVNLEFARDLGENIANRFLEIGSEIRKLEQSEYSFFIFKNTSCDDGVEYWFRKYNEDEEEYEESPLSELDELVTELIIIEDDKISGFIANTKLKDKFK